LKTIYRQSRLSRLCQFALSKVSRSAAAVALMCLAGASPALAQTNARLYTPITGAQTQIDSVHKSSWTITATSTISLDGGNFTIKRGSATTATITLTVYNGQHDRCA
jgi:hypothetical protein